MFGPFRVRYTHIDPTASRQGGGYLVYEGVKPKKYKGSLELLIPDHIGTSGHTPLLFELHLWWSLLTQPMVTMWEGIFLLGNRVHNVLTHFYTCFLSVAGQIFTKN